MEMNKSRRNLLILLVLIAVYAGYDFLKNKDQYMGYYSKKKIQEATEKKVQRPKVADPENKLIREASFVKTWGKDPFYDPGLNRKPVRRTYQPKVTEVYLDLKAISYSGENSVAMINNRILSVGDVISGYRVVRIDPKQVLLAKGNEQKRLILK